MRLGSNRSTTFNDDTAADDEYDEVAKMRTESDEDNEEHALNSQNEIGASAGHALASAVRWPSKRRTTDGLTMQNDNEGISASQALSTALRRPGSNYIQDRLHRIQRTKSDHDASERSVSPTPSVPSARPSGLTRAPITCTIHEYDS